MKPITKGTVLNDGTKEYTVKKHIGTGGFADVYMAENNGAFYAIKVIRSDDSQFINSLKNEFDIASKVVSEHAIRYYFMNEQGQDEYPCYIIMDYADGGSLYDELEKREKSGKRYTTKELLDIYYQLIDGMTDISKIAVHRDIKPQNILLLNGSYKISDYGLAKYAGAPTRAPSQTMKNAGTELYYAPELWAQPFAHGLNDVQVDIYAMGIVFYQLANLKYPYNFITDLGMMHMTAAIEPFANAVDPVIQSLIKKMMEKSKAKRFSTWLQVKNFLENSSLGCDNTRDSFVEQMLKFTMANKQAIDMTMAKEDKARSAKEAAFKRLISQIGNEIYEPLKQLVDNYNKDSAQHHVHLNNIVEDLADETFAFDYMADAVSSKEDARSISFMFKAIHPEIITRQIIRSKAGLSFEPEVFQQPQAFEYKYFGQRILLWGVVKADCGTGINVAILEDIDDPLYGKVKTFIRKPNVSNQDYWLPHENANLKQLCANAFREVEYTTEVKDFDFEVIKELILQNQIYPYNSIRDPIRRTKRFGTVKDFL